ncbi:MAG: adenylosuccinate synthase [Gaiellaceae bacterium]|nr:adenylosuccinate synthase [Gaiellaceae bacterium]
MPKLVVVLSGAVSSGKSTLADRLARRFGVHPIHTKDILVAQSRSRDRPTRAQLQRLGDRLDRETNGSWVADATVHEAADLPEDTVILIDSVRRIEQIEALRNGFGRQVVHVHLTAPEEELAERYRKRATRADVTELASYAEVRINRTEATIERLAPEADVVIDTAHCTAEDVVVRAATHLGLTSRDTGAFVDVIVGGQYGSEGKGHLAYHIAPAYDILMRVGGPNAGHQVIWPDGSVYTHRLLPSGTLASSAKLVIGPGAVIDIDILLTEVAECGVEVDRLVIDPQTMLITKGDKTRERRLKEGIGSTGQGGGAATVRRIERRDDVKLARDSLALRPYVRPVSEVLEQALATGGSILLEGTQGTALSLFHGNYPYVTSRDTTAAGCLSEAGLPPTSVRKVVMVCRTLPIRVQSPTGGTSGPMAQEVSWKDVAQRAGRPVEQLTSVEKGSVSGNLRRVSEFDWALLRKASVINGPTDIALTFVDYLSAANERARRFEQLEDETIRFIDEVERVAGAPVSLISTRFHPRSIIDRRAW